MSVLTVCSLSGILSNYPESLPGKKYQNQILLQKTKSKSSGSRILTLEKSDLILLCARRVPNRNAPQVRQTTSPQSMIESLCLVPLVCTGVH